MKVFIGWDSREEIAYKVAKFSIEKYNKSVEVIPVKQYELRNAGIYCRAKDLRSSTQFTITRFLVPYLCDYEGYAIFMDCDVVLQTDIEKILDEIEEENVVSCVQHDYTPKTEQKMDGKIQYDYPRKNWSSVMVFNCSHPLIRKNLNVAKVNIAKPAYLHRMNWAEEKIGSLSHTWNYLAGYYNDIEKPNLIHYTDGGPWFPKYENCELAEVWKKVLKESLWD